MHIFKAHILVHPNYSNHPKKKPNRNEKVPHCLLPKCLGNTKGGKPNNHFLVGLSLLFQRLHNFEQHGLKM